MLCCLPPRWRVERGLLRCIEQLRILSSSIDVAAESKPADGRELWTVRLARGTDAEVITVHGNGRLVRRRRMRR